MDKGVKEIIEFWQKAYPSLAPILFAETHISWIIRMRQLGDETRTPYIFKIKKPVKFSFLDYSTLKKREHYCEEEVRLNRRLCPEIYLGASTLIERNKQYAFVDKIEENDRVIDHAVKMEMLPQYRKMDVLLEKNEISRSHVIALAYVVAQFHKKIKTIREKKYSSPELVQKQIDDLIGVRDVVKKACGASASEKIDFILEKCNKFISKNAALMRKRQREGRIKDCHGDLHSANVFYVDGRFYIFDCIEFNEFFRYIDVASEIAFMAMDLDAFGREDLGRLFVDTYIKLSKDKELLKLLNLYKCYRANVRAKVAALAMSYGGIEGNKEIIEKYINLCERYAKQL